MDKQCIAIVGMCGAGKTEAVNFLMKKFNAPKVYFGEATFDRIKKDGLETNYKNEKETREKIRSELGMGAYAILAIPKIQKLLKTNNIVIAESLYSWDEYKIMRDEFKNNFKVIAICASPKIRFKRLSKRNNERPIKNINEFIERDYTEIEGTDKGGPIARADYTIINEGSLENLHNQLQNIKL